MQTYRAFTSMGVVDYGSKFLVKQESLANAR